MDDNGKVRRKMDRILLRALGKRMKESIERAGYTQKQAAEYLGAGFSSFKFYLDGDRPMPIDLLVNLAGLLNVPPAELLKHDDEDAEALLQEKRAVEQKLAEVLGELQAAVASGAPAEKRERLENRQRELLSTLQAYETRLKFLTAKEKRGDE